MEGREKCTIKEKREETEGWNGERGGREDRMGAKREGDVPPGRIST